MTADVAEQGMAPARRPAVSAGIPILAAKITVPGVPDWAVPRPRITKLIAEGARRCPLTIVTGPPGAGKTTALALWAAAEPRTVSWTSLDDFDNQPGAFWSYAVAALTRSGVAIPKVLAAASRHGRQTIRSCFSSRRCWLPRTRQCHWSSTTFMS